MVIKEALIALFCLVVAAAIAANLIVLWSSRRRILSRSQWSEIRDTAVVLGAPVLSDGSVSAILEDRLSAGLSLLRDEKVTRLLISGYSVKGNDEVGAMRAWLLERGVRESQLLVDPEGVRTLVSIRRAKEIFAVSRAYYCTQRFHLSRTLFLASVCGVDALGAESDRRGYKDWMRMSLRELVARVRACWDALVLIIIRLTRLSR